MKKLISVFFIAIVLICLMSVGIGGSYAASNFTTVSQFDKKTYTHYAVYKSAAVKDMIDVSEHNGLINFEKIKGVGIDDVIIRIGCRGYGSAGNIIEDNYYYDNVENAIDAGLNVGLYFYSQAVTTAEAKSEAEFCLKRAAEYKEYINLPIFFDYEFADVASGRLDKAWANGTLNKSKMTDNTIAFCTAILNAGYKTGVYASASFFTNQLNSTTLYNKGYEIWNAYYTTNSTSGSYWTNKNPVYRYWQYSASPNVQGCCGDPSSAWLKVKYSGTTGYVSAKYIDFTGATTGVSITDGLNLRSGAGTSNAVLTQIPFAGKVSILSYPTSTRTDVNFYYNTDQTPPAAPDFGLSAASGSVSLSWKAVSGAAYYEVYSYDKTTKEYTKLAQVSTTSYTHKGLKNDTEYTYLVRAFNSKNEGSAYTSSNNKSIKTVPSKPVFTLSAATTTVKLSWESVKNAAYYQLYFYNEATGEYTLIAKTDKTSYTVKGLTKSTKYTFLVRSFFADATGSTFSQKDNKSILTAPAKPVFNLTAKTANTISLSWKKVANADNYRIYAYDAQTKQYNRLALVSADKSSYTLKKLNSGTTYSLVVRAFNAQGAGSDHTTADNLKVQTLPAAPSFSLKSYSYSVKISWKPVDGAQFYRVYSYNKSTKKYTKLVQTSATAWEHKDLKGNTQYNYLVRAFENSSFGSAYTQSNVKTIKTLLRKPQFTLTVLSENSIKVQWAKIAGASAYRVYLYDAQTQKYTQLTKTTALSYTYKKAQVNQTYTFAVRAFDAKDVGSSCSTANHKSIMIELAKAVFALKSEKSGEVNISWNAVDNAAYYKIFMYNPKTGESEKLAKTEALMYTCKNLESGKEYSFLVRAYSASDKVADSTPKDYKSVRVV